MLKRISIGVLLALILVGAGIYFYLNSGQPKHSGRIKLAGLKAPVEVVRDRYGIPHIVAQNQEDAAFALGYCMAQDRLFQMELMRAAAEGRLAELLGPKLLDTDKTLRRLQLFTLSVAEVEERLPASIFAYLKAFVKGINSYLDQGKTLPLELRLLKVQPHRWKTTDVLSIAKLQSWQLSYNYKAELLYQQIIQKLGMAKAQELFPYYGPEQRKILDYLYTYGPSKGTQRLLAAAETISELIGEVGGSNCWAVSGSRTVNGKPILASDPHLFGSRLPSPWYFAHLKAPGLNVAGGCMAGLPLVLIGHNEHIAWGLTNMGPDVQDLFIEKVVPGDLNHYIYRDQSRAFKVRLDTIWVKDKKAPGGRRAEPIQLRSTIHGPVVVEGDTLMALSWSPRGFLGEMEAFYRINRARNWEEFVQGVAKYTGAPQNFVYADRDGHIGYYGAGRIPLRKTPHGPYPVPGWTGEYDWTGYIPFEELPHVFDPPQGYIATANTEVVGPGYPYPMPGVYSPDYRLRRIEEKLQSKSRTSLADHQALQLDQKSLLAPIFLRYLLAALPDSTEVGYMELRDWDGELAPESSAATLYHETLHQFLRLIWRDDLGPRLGDEYVRSWYLSLNRVLKMMEDNANPWFDDVRTPQRETRDELLRQAYQLAQENLAATFGTDDLSKWRWGRVHTVAFHHPFEKQGELFRKIFSYGPFPFGGDGETVNRAEYDFEDRYQTIMTASMRMIVDLAHPSEAYFANSGGQVGVVFNKHYTDLIDLWLAGRHFVESLQPSVWQKDLKKEVLQLLPAS